MTNSRPAYQTGDLVAKKRHGEKMAGLVLEGVNFNAVRVMWETGTASIELDDDLELLANACNRRRYLIQGDTSE